MTVRAERLKAEYLESRQGHSGSDAHWERAAAFRYALCATLRLVAHLAMRMGIGVETDWAVIGASEYRVPFRPKVLLSGQSVPSETILRGKSMGTDRRLLQGWRGVRSSRHSGWLVAVNARLTSAGFEGVHVGTVASDCSAGHLTWFIVLNAHAKRGQCHHDCRLCRCSSVVAIGFVEAGWLFATDRLDDGHRIVPAERLAPIDKLDGVQTPLTADGLVNGGPGLPQTFGELSYRQPKLLATGLESLGERLIGVLLERLLGGQTRSIIFPLGGTG